MNGQGQRFKMPADCCASSVLAVVRGNTSSAYRALTSRNESSMKPELPKKPSEVLDEEDAASFAAAYMTVRDSLRDLLCCERCIARLVGVVEMQFW